MRLGRAVSLALPLALALAVDVAQAAGPPPRVWANLAARRAALRLPLTECNPGWGQESMLCGTFDVYENRALGSGRRLSLWVVVIPSLAERPEPDPVFYLAGGPGGSASGAASWFATELPLRLKRDIVLVDLRGMGGSNPLLCDLVGDRDVLQNHLRDMYPPELVEECRRELEQRADLTQYTTANAMADLDDVRAWLGYERINLLALSYGGRAAYAYARAYPDHVRAIAMLGPADLEARLPMYHAPLSEKAFAALCADCRADSTCNAAYPEFEVTLRGLVARLRDAPAEVTYHHPDREEPEPLTVTADVFVEALRAALYGEWSRREVPWIVQHAADGDFGPFLDLALPRHPGEAGAFAEGAYLSYSGAEDAPFIDPQEAARLAAGTLLGDYRVAQQQRAAALWPRGELPADWFAPVVVQAPTLIIQGAEDPVTGIPHVARRFANVREVIVPHGGHVFDGLVGIECVDNLLVRFLESADTERLETDCVGTMRHQGFKVGVEKRE
ncbi:MAG: alpha/beta fold hydrolase [bacterium]|nr:alpha/beta fold hydrolase [bacterium]